MKTNLTITAAGNAALAAAVAGGAGADAVTITGIAVGSAPRVLPDIVGVTALQSQITRTDFRGDAGASPGSIAGYGLFEGSAAWTALEIGVYARVGNAAEILFAYAQSVANAAGVRVPLLTKTAGESARYDFAFIFSPSSVIAPSPCCVPATAVPATAVPATAVPVSLSCFAPPYYYAPPPSPPSPPAVREVWRSINTRAPGADDVAHPVGHLWMHDKNEWVLESIAAGAAQWRQTAGDVLLYSRAFGLSSSSREILRIDIAGTDDISDYRYLAFHSSVRSAWSSLNNQDFVSPIFILSSAFIAGEAVRMFRIPFDGNNDTNRCSYLSPRRILLEMEDALDFYISSVYGIY